MITIGKINLPTNQDIFTDDEIPELDIQLEQIYLNIKNYIKNANTVIENTGIGSYEYFGQRGYDSNLELIYDDETEFEIEYTHPQLPEVWPYLDSLTITIDYDDFEAEVFLVPKFKNNKCLFVVED